MANIVYNTSELAERIVEKARRVHSGEITFASFAVFVRAELKAPNEEQEVTDD